MQPVITLCGSTKFKEEFLSVARQLGEQGDLVISVTTFTHADDIPTSSETKAMLDAIHMQKIMMSSGIYVVNKGGYIGESTMREIAFAGVMDKTIYFHESPSKPVATMLDTLGAEYELAEL